MSSQENEMPLLETSKARVDRSPRRDVAMNMLHENVTVKVLIYLSFELVPCRLILG